MVMGTVAEEVAYEAIGLDLSKEQISDRVNKTWDKHYNDETVDEKEWAKEIAVTFTDNLRQFGKVVSYQNEKIIDHDKLQKKIKMITDFEFQNVIIDTKATAYLKRLKSGKLDSNWYPKQSDVRQQLLYQRCYNKPTMLLYASAKDHEAVDMIHRVSDIDLIQVFQTIEHICTIAKSKDDVVRMFPLTMDNFRWGKGQTQAKEFAMDIWKTVWKN
jgi:vacuolar-type H+-ATPase catalytic subunit A/Vma1